jgi:hypothetical protein
MKLTCPSCGATVPASDVNIQQAIAKCSRCDSVFRIDQQLPTLKSSPDQPAVPLPPKFRVEDLGTELTISWSWFTPSIFFLLFFCIFWDGFLIAWYSIVLGVGVFGMGNAGPAGGIPALLMALFPILHVAVGVGLTYFVIASFVNRTRVRVDRGELSIHHGPIPFPGNKILSTANLTQFYCTETVSNRRRGYSVSYDLNAVQADGTKVKLLTGLTELEQALYLEQRLEKFLGIENERVPGEVRV